VGPAPPYWPRTAKTLFVIGLGLVILLSVIPSGSGDQVGSRAWSTVGHLAAYGLLAACGTIAFPRREPFWSIGFGLVLLGVILEFVQILVPGRTFSLVDMAANAAGVALGLWLRSFIARRAQAK
jgi:VanZ family protein